MSRTFKRRHVSQSSDTQGSSLKHPTSRKAAAEVTSYLDKHGAEATVKQYKAHIPDLIANKRIPLSAKREILEAYGNREDHAMLYDIFDKQKAKAGFSSKQTETPEEWAEGVLNSFSEDNLHTQIIDYFKPDGDTPFKDLSETQRKVLSIEIKERMVEESEKQNPEQKEQWAQEQLPLSVLKYAIDSFSKPSVKQEVDGVRDYVNYAGSNFPPTTDTVVISAAKEAKSSSAKRETFLKTLNIFEELTNPPQIPQTPQGL